jgi:hypothetical protein
VTARAQLLADRDRVVDALERVERVDEEGDVRRHRRRVLAKRALLVAPEHHPRVRVRALDRDAVHLAGEHVRRRRHAADPRRTARRQTAIDALRAPQPELDHGLAARRLHHAGRLGRDERAEVDHGEERRLDETRLQDRRAHAHQRLVREAQPPFGHRVDGAGEAQRREMIDEALLEQRLAVGAAQRSKVFTVAGVEREMLEVVERLVEPGRDRMTTAERMPAEMEMEHALALRDAGLPVPVRHRELIQVGQEREGRTIEIVELAHAFPPACPERCQA